jgi:hypothetical protein
MSGSAVGQAGYGFATSFVQGAKWAAYEKHMLALIDRYPQLRQIVNERSALEERYRSIRREKLRRDVIVQ